MIRLVAFTTLDAPPKTKKALLRYLRWRDVLFLAAGIALGLSVKHYYSSLLSDIQKWKARPKLSPHVVATSQEKPKQNGPLPCLFIVPPTAVDQPIASGTIADCLMLVPDGRRWDLFEVVLLSGSFIPIKTDLYVPDVIPLAFTRTYRPLHDWSKRFQVYVPHVYDPFLFGDRNPYTYLTCLLPDGNVVYYRRISPGTGYADAVYEEALPLPVFEGSRVAWNGNGWGLSLADGTTYLSPEAYYATRPQQGSLVGIFDKEGNEVRLSRESNGNLIEIKSPSGRWIRLRYDEGRISRATDSLGNTVNYTYDLEQHLQRVRNSHGQVTEYIYDYAHRIVRIGDATGRIVLENGYDDEGRVLDLLLPDGSSYYFKYVFDEKKPTGHVDIIDPKGQVTRVTLDRKSGEDKPHYTVEKLSSAAPAHR